MKNIGARFDRLVELPARGVQIGIWIELLVSKVPSVSRKNRLDAQALYFRTIAKSYSYADIETCRKAIEKS